MAYSVETLISCLAAGWKTPTYSATDEILTSGTARPRVRESHVLTHEVIEVYLIKDDINNMDQDNSITLIHLIFMYWSVLVMTWTRYIIECYDHIMYADYICIINISALHQLLDIWADFLLIVFDKINTNCTYFNWSIYL